MKARLFYVAEFFDQHYGWKGKRVLDIGAGEGTFLKFIQQRDAWISGLDPSLENCTKIEDLGARAYCQTIEDPVPDEKFDVVTILWTLENCQDCMGMLEFARECLKSDGHLVVATGSRINVPFKKPLSKYFSHNPADTHCFRFSATSLDNALSYSGFQISAPEVNDYKQSDWLVMMARSSNKPGFYYVRRGYHCKEAGVVDFFNRWDREFP